MPLLSIDKLDSQLPSICSHSNSIQVVAGGLTFPTGRIVRKLGYINMMTTTKSRRILHAILLVVLEGR